MNDSKHWYPCTVCGAHLKEASHTYTGDQCTICNYHKVGGRIQISQLSTLPSALKDVDAVNSFDKLKSEMTASVQKVDKDIKAGIKVHRIPSNFGMKLCKEKVEYITKRFLRRS